MTWPVVFSYLMFFPNRLIVITWLTVTVPNLLQSSGTLCLWILAILYGIDCLLQLFNSVPLIFLHFFFLSGFSIFQIPIIEKKLKFHMKFLQILVYKKCLLNATVKLKKKKNKLYCNNSMSSIEACTGGDLENNIALKIIIVQEPEGPTWTPPAPQDPLGFFETLYPLD